MKQLLSFVLLLFPLVALAQVATIIASETDFEVSNARSATCRYHLVVRVNSEHGASAAVFHSQCNDAVSLSKFSGNVVDAQGKEILKIKKSDLTRSEYAQELRTDDYSYIFGYKAHSYPYTVTYDWEERYEGSIPFIPAFIPQPGFDMDVISATYSITAPESYGYDYCALGFKPDIHKKKVGNNSEKLSIALTNLPAIHHYEFGRPLSEQIPIFYASPKMFYMKGTRCELTDWQHLGQWEYELMEGRDRIPAALSQKLKALTDTCTSDRSRVEAVRRMMGETTRYVAILEGLGGFQTMTVEEVTKYGMGDCKALTNYLCAMLHHIGLPADYALISTRDKRLRDIPSMQQLNHVIARVPLPNDTLWIECTNPTYPYYHLPADLCDHDVVIITPEGGKLERTPKLSNQDHAEVGTYDITLDEQGLASLHIEKLTTGRIYDSYLGLTNLSPTDQRKSMVQLLGLPKSSVSNLELRHEQEKLRLLIDMQSQGYAKRTGNRLFVPLCPDPFSSLRNANEPAHEIDLRQSGYVQQDVITFHLPAGYSIEHLPEAQHVEASFGSLTITPSQVDESTVQVSFSFQSNSQIYPADQYDAWVAYRKSLSTMSGIRMILIK